MTIVLQPRISEQTFAQSQNNVYVFNVETSVNKQEIREAVEEQFDVTVTGVKTLVLKGKKKASNQKRKQAIYGNRKDIKKAYVTIKDGDKISVFEDLQ